jgi:hypothetical protein
LRVSRAARDLLGKRPVFRIISERGAFHTRRRKSQTWSKTMAKGVDKPKNGTNKPKLSVKEKKAKKKEKASK